MPALQPVDFDPFSTQRQRAPTGPTPKLQPVDHDPFATPDPAGAVLADVPGSRITSERRSVAHNAAVGGAPNSFHLRGEAVDFVPPKGMTRAQALAAIRARDPHPRELLDEGDHVHYTPSAVPMLSPVDHDPFASPAAKTPAPAPRKPAQALGGPPAGSPTLKPAQGFWGDVAGEFRHGLGEDLREQYAPQNVGNPVGETIAAFDAAQRAIAALTVPLAQRDPAAQSLTPQHQRQRGETAASILSGLIPVPGAEAVEWAREAMIPLRERAEAAEGAALAAHNVRPAYTGAFGPGGRASGVGDAARAVAAPARAVGKAVQATFSPASMSEQARDVAHYIRKAGGRGQLQADQTAASLLRLDKKVARGTPEQTRAMIAFIEGRSSTEAAGKGAFVPRPGGKSYTMTAGELKAMRAAGISTEDVDIANQIRDAYKGYRDRAEYVIAQNVGAAPKFITDYYSHMWRESPEVVDERMRGFFKQGSGRNFRQRSIPTMEDGLARGLTPKYDNPIEATIVYAQNMSNFLATHDVQGWMKTQGHAKWFSPGQQPDGWVPLNGILTERVPRISRPKAPGGEDTAAAGGEDRLRLGGPTQPALGGPAAQSRIGRDLRDYEEPPLLGGPGGVGGGDVARAGQPRPGDDAIRVGGASTARVEDAAAKARNVTPEPETPAKGREPKADTAPRKQVLYAPEDAARIYNNWISKGLEANTAVGRGFAAARKITNATTAAKLSLSAFHAVTMAQEAAVSSVARAFQALSRGDVVTAGKGLSKAPVSMLTSGLRGRRMGQELLGLKTGSPLAQKVNQAFIDSGGRIRMDKLYRTSDGRSFYDAIKSGTFRRELGAAAQRMFGADRTLAQRAGATVETAANLVQSIFQGPLFEDIIPAVKRGAFAERMGDFLKANPDASQTAIDRYAVTLQDSIDNRFGELVQDNLFWHKQMKQVAQILLLSPTWDIGTIREIGGGLADLFGASAKGVIQGKGISDRTAYVAALLATVAAENGLMTALKTGKPPKDVRDLEAYRTGGTDERLGGSPERGLTPGYQKDVFATADALTPGSGGPLGMLRSKLSPAAGAVVDVVTNTDYAGRPVYGPGARDGAALDAALDALMPISVGAFAKGKTKGSNLSDLERGLSIRQAPSYLADPEGLASVRRRALTRSKKSATRSHARAEARIQP